jgi:hypothetical protein
MDTANTAIAAPTNGAPCSRRFRVMMRPNSAEPIAAPAPRVEMVAASMPRVSLRKLGIREVPMAIMKIVSPWVMKMRRTSGSRNAA